MTNDVILQISDLRTQFGDKVVHADLNLSIPTRGIHAIIGESGCGKSVLLREIVGLTKPYAGKIELLGNDVWSLTEEKLIELRTRFSLLFQDGALFSSLTVAENVAAPIEELLSLPKEFISQLVDLRLSLSGLDLSHRDKMPSDLSGGMRKRVALARALSLEPEILFLDEPTSGLDPITARTFDRVIKTIVQGLNITVLLVTHDIDTIYGIVDTVTVLAEKKVLAQGTVDQIRKVEHPWIKRYFSMREQETPVNV